MSLEFEITSTEQETIHLISYFESSRQLLFSYSDEVQQADPHRHLAGPVLTANPITNFSPDFWRQPITVKHSARLAFILQQKEREENKTRILTRLANGDFLPQYRVELVKNAAIRKQDLSRALAEPERFTDIIMTLPSHMQPGITQHWRELFKIVRASDSESKRFNINLLKAFENENKHLVPAQWKEIMTKKDENTGNTVLHELYASCLKREDDIVPVIQASMILLRHKADSKTIKNNTNETAFQFGCKFADLLKGRLKEQGVESLGPEMVIAVLSLNDIGLPEPGIVDFLNLMKKFEAKTISRKDFDDAKKDVFEKYGFSIKAKG